MPADTAEASASRLFAITILTGIHPSGVTEEPFGEFLRYSVFHTAREELGSTIAQIYAGYVGLIRRLNETSNKVARQTERRQLRAFVSAHSIGFLSWHAPEERFSEPHISPLPTSVRRHTTPRRVLFSPRKMMSSEWKPPLSQEFRSNVVDVQPASGLDPFAPGNDLLWIKSQVAVQRRG